MPSPAATPRPSTCSASPARRSPSALTYHNAAVALCEPGVATEVACAGSVTEGRRGGWHLVDVALAIPQAAPAVWPSLAPAPCSLPPVMTVVAWKLVEDESCGPSDTIGKERLGSLYESTHSSCKMNYGTYCIEKS
ncbi:hypothetical protein SEVIR_2G399600v4 [Setaria viridis]|uniref:Uncharacterized protein n=1 Tax=Setaria viridis TaxID=4556 RepID=A0A4U6W0D5_SETVI|nr:hypothetical protein SEVIR_2G399600v2 [Setaria viridis]